MDEAVAADGGFVGGASRACHYAEAVLIGDSCGGE